MQVLIDSEKNGRSVELDNASIGLVDLAKVIFSLGLIGLVIYFFNIEEGLHLMELMKVVIPGFLIYTLLPLRFRMPFFFFLNIALLVLLFGIAAGCQILALCILIIVLTQLPIKWNYKAILLVLVTLSLVLIRLNYFQWENSTQIATVVGVMFMFRSVLYMYELQYEKERPSFWKRVNYFMLLPNLVFFIFPIVDYKTFVRNYYDKPAFENYSKGLKWMFIGLIHFLFYRVLYYYFLPGLNEVQDVYKLLQYMCVSYALIVRLSGIFHFSAGVLCLFGFNLPETFSNYFLATSFSDLWRRINIYWKDFVMKVFYFPIYFKFKKRNNRAVFITVLIVFFFNWFFHAYQWFWIRGAFLLKTTDVVFWLCLGLFVAINSVYQKNTKLKKKKNLFEFRPSINLVLKIVGMYILMSFLWVFWISPDMKAWWLFLTGITAPSLQDLINLFLVFAGIIFLGVGIHFVYHRFFKERMRSSSFNLPNLVIVNSSLLFLVIIGNSFTTQQFQNYLNINLEPILTSKLNKSDQQQLFNGYYDELIVGNNLNTRMWEVDQEKPEGWGKLNSTGIMLSQQGLLNKKMKPNQQIIFKNQFFNTNEFGLRDKDYPLQKKDGTLRMALLGGSMEVGSGVADDQTYENILEGKLNVENNFDNYSAIEIINFSTSGIHMPQHVDIAEQSVPVLQPDVLLYAAHTTEIFRSLRRFSELMNKPERIKGYPFLEKLALELELTPELKIGQVRRKLDPYAKDLYEWGLDRIVQMCRDNEILPVYIYIQALGDDPMKSEHIEIKALVESKGFYFLDLNEIFNDVDHLEMAIANYDFHPNEKGHLRIAEKLYEMIQSDTKLRMLIDQTAYDN